MEFTVSFYAADLGMTVHNSTYSGLLPGRPKPVKGTRTNCCCLHMRNTRGVACICAAVPVAMVKTVTDPTGPAGQLAVGDIILKINSTMTHGVARSNC